MSINRLIEDTYKPWLNARVNNLTVDGVITVPQVSLTANTLINGATVDLARCLVTRIGKLYTFTFHFRLSAVVAGQPAIISFTPAGLAKIPGYVSSNTNLEQTATIFKLTARPGLAADVFGIQAIQNTPTFGIVSYGTDAIYDWQAGDAPCNFCCTIQVEAQ